MKNFKRCWLEMLIIIMIFEYHILTDNNAALLYCGLVDKNEDKII